MRVDVDDVLVTTGGQQVIDLVTKTLVDPGDVVICEAPTYPGAVPVFSSYEADVVQIEMDSDGMRIDLLEETLARLETRRTPAEVHLHRADLPEPGRRDALGTAAATAGRDRARPRAARAGGQPLRPAALRGRAAAARCARSTAASTCSTSERSRRSSHRASGSDGSRRPAPVLAQDQARQAGGRPLHLLAHAAARRRLFRAKADGVHYVQDLCTIYRRRRDAMLDALAEFFPAEAEWTQPGGGLFIWATLPGFHRHRGPAREGDPRGERRVRARLGGLRGRPGRQLDAAQLLGRGRRRHRRRASAASARSSTSRSASTERSAAARRAACIHRAADRRAGAADAPANVVQLPRRPSDTRARRAAAHEPQRVAVLKGGPVARAPGLAALRRPGRGRARTARPRGRADRRRRAR